MTQILFRIIGAAVVAVVLALQARSASGPLRRRAFGLGSAAFALLGLGNLLGALGVTDWPAYGATIAGVALMLASLATLFFAYRAGELNPQLQRAGELVSDERRKREEAARKTPK